MGWFGNRLRRGITNRSYEQICREVGSAGPGSAIFAVAMAAAVYPDAKYGSAEWDQFGALLSRKPIVDPKTAAQISESWVDRHEMTWDECIRRLYGCNPDDLLSSDGNVAQQTSQATSKIAQDLQRRVDENVKASDEQTAR